MVNVLVVGSGGREHALSWKLSQSELVDEVYVAPGNGGTSQNIPISVDDIDALANFAQEKSCFTVVGPEAPLANGLVDKFIEKGLAVFGPSKQAAQLESSKIWAKEFMKRNDIPTADFEIFDDAQKAKEFVSTYEKQVVIKADGLAAGKGVIVCSNNDEANDAIDKILVKKEFGDAGSKIIIEERVDGIEASYIALCDGQVGIPMATSQDHKRIYDDDKGPNTGGMGAYSPTPVIDNKLGSVIQEQIIAKTISSMTKEGIEFRGFLYAGIMIRDGKPYVLEYNVRMGDPECQPILMRLDSDLYKYLKASSEGKLNDLAEISWKDESSVCIVLASNGYPNSYPKGDEITGLSYTSPNSFVFHAGTKNKDGKIVSNCGRVLGVTALGASLNDAINNAYSTAQKIHWKNKYQRNDIGKKGLSYL